MLGLREFRQAGRLSQTTIAEVLRAVLAGAS